MFSKPLPKKKVLGGFIERAEFHNYQLAIIEHYLLRSQEDEQWLDEESVLPAETSWWSPTVQTASDQLLSTQFRILRVFL